jgi:hypothetical protein
MLASQFDSRPFVRYTLGTNALKSSVAANHVIFWPAVALLPRVSSPKGIQKLAR